MELKRHNCCTSQVCKVKRHNSCAAKSAKVVCKVTGNVCMAVHPYPSPNLELAPQLGSGDNAPVKKQHIAKTKPSFNAFLERSMPVQTSSTG